jgi:2'-hydroxyisoflavone reductase
VRILFIGGTRFVGLAMAQCALARGHHVDIFHRGSTQASGLDAAAHILGDRGKDLTALATGHWDAVVDVCAYRPHEVHTLWAALGKRARHYLFISSISVYAEDVAPGCNEQAALLETNSLEGRDLQNIAIDAETYGRLKVLCEQAVVQHFPRHTLIRPTFVIGPQDYTQRYPEWVRRIAAGGEVAAPEPRDAPMSYIDARDLAAFVIRCLESDRQSIFNVSAPPVTFEEFLNQTLNAVAPQGTDLKWLTPKEASASGKAFPLWTSGEHVGKLAPDRSKAAAAGLSCRALQESARDVLGWVQKTAL